MSEEIVNRETAQTALQKIKDFTLWGDEALLAKSAITRLGKFVQMKKHKDLKKLADNGAIKNKNLLAKVQELESKTTKLELLRAEIDGLTNSLTEADREVKIAEAHKLDDELAELGLSFMGDENVDELIDMIGSDDDIDPEERERREELDTAISEATEESLKYICLGLSPQLSIEDINGREMGKRMSLRDKDLLILAVAKEPNNSIDETPFL